MDDKELLDFLTEHELDITIHMNHGFIEGKACVARIFDDYGNEVRPKVRRKEGERLGRWNDPRFGTISEAIEDAARLAKKKLEEGDDNKGK